MPDAAGAAFFGAACFNQSEHAAANTSGASAAVKRTEA
jgi:hypothetical protein